MGIPQIEHEPTAKERLGLLRAAQSIAIVGFSPNTARSSYYVATYLVQDTDYTLYFINPNAAGQSVLGLPVYASLQDLPEVPDVVDVFRRTSDLPGVVDEVIALGSPVVWFQLGLVHDEAAATARAAGITVVQNRCLKIEHARFHGGLHLAGFDTGRITSRKAAR
ncbi:CoA-binding protein [Nocardioides sp. Kera G14]|uniref:CoA-binding protein n=1 Tax=Nocardioides sp. Kera G14 TaxID=2884264 RepID=UPI001D11BDF7|nr:CoA-binding protein [Nocardioides sp. Kera G14]UDY23653.1 CoA-binding protein [Nocardioides sp. Kera G14]